MNVVSMRENIDPSYYRLLAGEEKGSLIDTFEAKRPSIAERLAAGKALREKVPRASHAHYESRADRPDPVAILEKQNATRVPEAGAGALCAHARLALRLPARLGGGDGERSVAHAGHRPGGGGVRRHACLQFRRLRLGRAQPGLRHQRFRRGPSRPVGMGRQAAGGERRRRGPLHGRRQGAGRRTPRGHACAVYRKHMRRYAEMGYLEVWYDRIDEQRGARRRCRPRCAAAPKACSPRRAPRDTCRSLDKLTEQVDGEHRIIEEVPLIVRETHTDTGVPISGGARPDAARLYRDARRSTGGGCCRATASSTWRARWWASAASAPDAGSSCWRASTTTIRCSCRSRRRSPRCWRPTSISALPFDNQGQRVVVGQRTDPGLARHLPRLGRGRRPALLCPPARRHEGQREVHRRHDQGDLGGSSNIAACAAGRWRWPTPSRATRR